MKNLLVAIVILATPITQAQLTAEQKEEQLRDRRPHRVLNQITYDESENQIKVANNVNSATGQKPRITIFEFDEKNRIKSETNAYYRLKKTYTYEKSKIIERIEHGGGTTIVILLDDFGREIKRSFKYDDRPKVDVTITEYSEDGLEKKTSYDDGRVHTERFDRQGNRLFFSNKAPDGSTDVTEQEFNLRNQIVKRIENGVVVDFIYDGKHNLEKTLRNSEPHEQYTYDDQNRVLTSERGKGWPVFSMLYEAEPKKVTTFSYAFGISSLSSPSWWQEKEFDLKGRVTFERKLRPGPRGKRATRPIYTVTEHLYPN